MFYSKETKELSTKEIYFFLIGAISPRPIAWVSTLNKEGQANLAPFSFFNAFSSNPPVVIFSPAVSPDPNRLYKDTYLNLIETQECVVNLVNYELCEQMNLSSKDLEHGQSEFDFAQLESIESDLIKAPRVKQAPVQLECKLMEMKQLGDKPGAGNLAICEIVKFHFNEKIFKEGTTRIDAELLDAVGRNGEYYYTRASGDALFEIKRPS